MAEKILSRGQITIVDLNDARQVQVYLNASLGNAQQYNPDTKTYVPAYTTAAPNIVKAAIYETGNPNNRVADAFEVVWTVNGTEIPAGTTKNGFVAATDTLKITSNITTNQLNIKYSAKVPDSVATGVNITVESSTTIIRSSSAGALFSVVLTAPKGNSFDQCMAGALTAVATCYRGGTQDSTNIAYTWQKLDTATGTWSAVDSGMANGATLTVTADKVLNFQTYKVIAKDTEDNKTAEALITFEDRTDPYDVQLFSPTGNIIKNGTGSTKIQASVWQNGEMIESPGTAAASLKFNYAWTKYDKNGNVVAGFSATGNEITVQAADISEKATYVCEISKK